MFNKYDMYAFYLNLGFSYKSFNIKVFFYIVNIFIILYLHLLYFIPVYYNYK